MTTIISQADTWVNTDGHNNEMHNLRSSVLLTQQHNTITTVWKMGCHCQHFVLGEI